MTCEQKAEVIELLERQANEIALYKQENSMPDCVFHTLTKRIDRLRALANDMKAELDKQSTEEAINAAICSSGIFFEPGEDS